jgi:hypothetical protein
LSGCHITNQQREHILPNTLDTEREENHENDGVSETCQKHELTTTEATRFAEEQSLHLPTPLDGKSVRMKQVKKVVKLFSVRPRLLRNRFSNSARVLAFCWILQEHYNAILPLQTRKVKVI